jgi:integrase
MSADRKARKSRNTRNTSAKSARDVTTHELDTPAPARVKTPTCTANPPSPAPNRPETTTVFTVRNLVDSFLAETALLVRAGVTEAATQRWYTDQFKHLDSLGGFPADALRTHHLATIELTNGFTRALKRLYRWAAGEELIPKDHFAKLRTPPCGQRERVLTPEELARLYRASLPALRRLLFVQLNTLARPGEIRLLEWGQIDWDKRVIVLVKFKGKKRRRDQLKARAIPLPKHVLRLLRNLYRKSRDPSPTGRVFYSTRGKPWSYTAVRSAMRRARAAAGLDAGDEPVVCYHLRHTGATTAIRRGENLKLVAEVMGHARSSTTERYLHLNTADAVGAIDRISARPRTPTRSAPAPDPPAA